MLIISFQSITRVLETQTPKKKSKVASCTPKKLLTPKASRLFQNPAGPYAVRTSNFVHVASLQLTKSNLMKSHFALDRVSNYICLIVEMVNIWCIGCIFDSVCVNVVFLIFVVRLEHRLCAPTISQNGDY
jgi:hypothetical protein